MPIRFRILLPAVAVALTLLAGTAVAADKNAENAERTWNPLAGLTSVLGDIAEVEPNNSLATAQALPCGSVLRPASIGAPADTDYVVFTATAGTIFSIGTDADGTTGQIGDTRIRLFNDSGAVLASDDDSGPGLYSLITFTATYTGTYYVGFAAYGTTNTGAYKGFVNCQEPQPPPPNDVCAGAIELLCGTVGLSGTTQFANNDYTPIASGLGGCTGYAALGKDVVYLIAAGAGDSVDLTYTSAADASIYILTDCSTPTTSCVAGRDSTVSGQPEHLVYTFPTTGAYFLILDNYGTNAGGAWTLTGTFTCPVVPAHRATWGGLKTIYR
jgi:hypothetical protein